ncbi:MAG: pyridoxamine 5'-phosphate oxidase family protein [Candidatus Omnitrophica bacterium]|nr:pyridoxamine 5'-phosphate oxidase family protein [Candidatus Omnitrophota bacterium]
MLDKNIIRFFKHQHFSVVTTVDANGMPHNSCKGVVEIDDAGRVYLLDLYKKETYKNLKRNPHVSITAVDEHKFIGYSIKGNAKIVNKGELDSGHIEAWEKRISNRITQRLLKEIRGEKGHEKQPEALMPKPAYLILVEVESVVDLVPHHMRDDKS